MSEKLISKIKKTFEESVFTKQAALVGELYQVLVSAGDEITNSIIQGGKLMICGNGGGEALDLCDSAFVVPSNITARIQETYITAGHAMLQYIEDALLDIGYLENS